MPCLEVGSSLKGLAISVLIPLILPMKPSYSIEQQHCAMPGRESQRRENNRAGWNHHLDVPVQNLLMLTLPCGITLLPNIISHRLVHAAY
jgi:hypothetical protein